jgi:hypothetical protein
MSNVINPVYKMELEDAKKTLIVFEKLYHRTNIVHHIYNSISNLVDILVVFYTLLTTLNSQFSFINKNIITSIGTVIMVTKTSEIILKIKTRSVISKILSENYKIANEMLSLKINELLILEKDITSNSKLHKQATKLWEEINDYIKIIEKFSTSWSAAFLISLNIPISIKTQLTENITKYIGKDGKPLTVEEEGLAQDKMIAEIVDIDNGITDATSL